ncbi:MAG: hypothetical protein M1829_003599 [Trizodia sp. TS-e1964]|nr:MAG: hypothetical protein M1829_003599 [Trizodia sp. TS-e1964]
MVDVVRESYWEPGRFTSALDQSLSWVTEARSLISAVVLKRRESGREVRALVDAANPAETAVVERAQNR